MNRVHNIPFVFFALLLVFAISCKPELKENKSASKDLPQLKEEGEITAVTLYGSTSYFRYKMQPMGYEYDMVKEFVESLGLTLNLVVAENTQQLTDMLHSGEADIVAYPMQVDKRGDQNILYCGHESQTTQVLIQRSNKNDTIINDVTQLIGKEVYVIPGTRFSERLANLNKELGGGIIIKEIEGGSNSVEDLIEMVSTGEISYTICDDNTAKLNKTYFWNIDASLSISFLQRSSWVVRKSSQLLANAIDEWAQDTAGKRVFRATIKRYFELSKQPLEETMPEIKNGHISPYDDLFKHYASTLGWDWQILASISYQESRFNPRVTSWAGAEGIMGIMPRTARALGFTPQDLKDPDTCIRISVETLRRFRQGFSKIQDPAEKMKFTLGSYNAGIGHIYDAQRLAEKYGKDPLVWDDNVADFIRLKSEATYYNDSICKHGYLRGSETFNYVKEVMERYLYYKKRTG